MQPIPTRNDVRFEVFTFGWALVVLLGMSSERMAQTPMQAVVCVACGLALVMPRSVLALGGVALAYVVHFLVDDYRATFVHTAFVFAGSVGVLLALVPAVHRDASVWRGRFVDIFGPVGLAQAAVCFFAAGFAKVNTDYLAVETSCGAVFYAHQITAFPYSLLPSAPWAETGALYLALLLELVTPWLWLHYRTRKVGFWLGGFLLFLLGTNARARYYVFTGPFLALLLLGFDWEPVRRWIAERAPLARIWEASRIARWILVPIGIAWALLQGDVRDAFETRWFVARVVFVVWALGLFAAAVFAEPVRLSAPRVPRLARVAWVVVLLYVAHEALPYLGLKASRNFSMAGNLAINRDWTNHLLVSPPKLAINELAVLESSNDPTLDRGGRTVWPVWVLYDYLARHPRVSATFTVGGERVRVARGRDVADRRSKLARILQITPSPREPVAVRCGHGRPE